ncbi:MAG TPA: alpha/beta fold hydrolase, partial [Candidatus Aminicenantes bacterium]|nr:alpha/beta fold hydrolase [Candidatus Aminicenantes bacterium]
MKTKDPFTTAAYIDPSSIDFGTLAYVVKPFPTPEPGTPLGYTSDLQGNLAYAYTTDNGVDRLFRLADDQWVPCPVNLDEIDVLGSDRDGQLIVLGPQQEGKPRAIQYLDAATGKLGEVICQDDKYDPSNCSLYRHPVTKALLGIRYTRSMHETLWFHPGYRVVQQAVEKFLPNQIVLILGSDKAEKRFFVAAYSDRQPTRYYTVDLEKRTLNLVKNPSPWIDPARMQPMNLLSYKSRDGKILEGYLTLPAGASKTHPAPLVVLPHGGPWVRDAFGFDSEVQFLASRGYAVFQPNYRGSLGSQWRFPDSDMYEFRKMHDDVTDGVKRMLKSGLIDPDRVAIMGWSFGGYLALSGAVHDGGLYRCAVALSGVYDWEQVIKESKLNEYVRGREGFLRRHLGDPKTNQEKFDAISPLRHVANVKIPLFVGHGTADHIADIAQSKRLVAELKKHGVPVVTHFESGEGHGMAQMKNRIEMYEK